MNVSSKYDDAGLIEAIRDPRRLNEAILSIYQQYSETVSSFIIHYGGDRSDGQDVFQETVVSFIDIVKQDKFRKEASIKTFLVSIARNVWFSELRKKERAGKRERLFESGRDQQDPGISEYISHRETRQELGSLLYKLGEPCRKVLMMFYYENLSMKEMLDHLPYENEQVIRNKKYKCLQQLTGMIKDHPLLGKEINKINK
jgi:RNA polymerase sigma factor (sigma-70 family)